MTAVKPSKKKRGKLKEKAVKLQSTKDTVANTHIKFDANTNTKKDATTKIIKKRARPSKETTKKKNTDQSSGKNHRSPESVQSVKYYLEQWERRNEPITDGQIPWKFKKFKQVWIERWLYEADVIPKSMFSLALDYLSNVQGLGRARILESAQKIIDAGVPPKVDENIEDKDKLVEDKLLRRRYKRALQVAERLAL